MTEEEAVAGLRVLVGAVFMCTNDRDQVANLAFLEAIGDMMPAVADYLSCLPSLEWVDFDDTELTDEHLPFLYGLKQIRAIDLDGNNVTSARVDLLRAHLPACKITFNG